MRGMQLARTAEKRAVARGLVELALIEKIELAARQAESFAEVDLDEVLGGGHRALPVQPPLPSVGQHSPAELPGGQVVGAA